MKKLLLTAIFMASSLSAIAQQAESEQAETTQVEAKMATAKPQYAKFQISAGYMFDVSNGAHRSDFGYVDFSYRFTRVIGLQAAFGMGNTYQTSNPTAYSGTISVVANPMGDKSNFSLVPSLGVGLSWNYPINDAKQGANVFMDLTVLAKYKVTDMLFCGLELKTLCYGTQNASLLAGVRIGLNF